MLECHGQCCLTIRVLTSVTEVLLGRQRVYPVVSVVSSRVNSNANLELKEKQAVITLALGQICLTHPGKRFPRMRCCAVLV